ncbi:COMM domain-containing protein 4 isoform X2 [Anabrus simplex]|uniref:COMM domain-containing protein 4 isoform X2 n=1 Tax=Anabrus simplex TaxID=316456 RepID=UPI0035A322C1
MRFRFCGDLDCPDWILAEINTIARMTSIKMKLLCQEIAKQFSGESLDYEKVKKLTADARFEIGDAKAAVAALTFIMTSSAQHGVDEEALNSELQQLGLPREHSLALCRVYSEQLSILTQVLRASSLRFGMLKNVDSSINIVSSSSAHLVDIMKPQLEVQVKIETLDGVCDLSRMHKLILTEEQLVLLVSDVVWIFENF